MRNLYNFQIPTCCVCGASYLCATLPCSEPEDDDDEPGKAVSQDRDDATELELSFNVAEVA